jgi:hypothetical protein
VGKTLYIRPEECDSDKCDLKMAIAAIMVAILAAIFNMVAKTHKQFRNAPITKKIDIYPIYQFSLKLEHFEILRILAAILKIAAAAKMTAILKSHWSRSHSSKKNLNINFPSEICCKCS